MSKLQNLRNIGEAYARSMDADIIGNDDMAEMFFKDLSEIMYPHSLHRREWALTNLHLFYTQEQERITIMKRLSDMPENVGFDIIEDIRRRQKAASHK